MARALIQTVNAGSQPVADATVLNLGTVVRRYGCALRLSGNGIEVSGEGYYTIDAAVTVTPTAAGAVTLAIYENGVQIPGAIASGYQTTAAQPITLNAPPATIRKGCGCEGASQITVVVTADDGTVSNAAVRIVKE